MKREKTNLSNYILTYPHAEKRRVVRKRESAEELLLGDMPLFSPERRTLTTKHCSYVSLKLDQPHHTLVHTTSCCWKVCIYAATETDSSQALWAQSTFACIEQGAVLGEQGNQRGFQKSVSATTHLTLLITFVLGGTVYGSTTTLK